MNGGGGVTMDMNLIWNELKNRTPTILGSEKFVNFSVLLPIVETEKGLHILFEVRSKKMRRQPGEICFPGGKVDPHDRTEKDAAIRETTEELGIPSEAISDIYPLDYIVSPFGTIIYPFVGKISTHYPIKENPNEVAETFLVPLRYFKENKPEVFYIKSTLEPEERFPFHHIPGGENYNWQTREMKEYFFYFEDKVIWGLTARVLMHFLELVDSMMDK